MMALIEVCCCLHDHCSDTNDIDKNEQTTGSKVSVSEFQCALAAFASGSSWQSHSGNTLSWTMPEEKQSGNLFQRENSVLTQAAAVCRFYAECMNGFV